MKNKELKKGYTTGTCAAAATLGAAIGAITGNKTDTVNIKTPKGEVLTLELLEYCISNQKASCAIQKNSGDDPDVTNGALIFATVTLKEKKEVTIIGGKGVGKVTKPGLACEVSMAAINPVPRQMIMEQAKIAMELCGYDGGLEVEISVPNGEELAKKTFNPKLGIVGGISILGTSGIVEPMSEQALIDTIKVELSVRKAEGKEYIVITPGNYGQDFLRNQTVICESDTIKCSNFVGEAIDFANEMGFKGIIFSGHLGKLIKVAGGVMNTHSKYGDRRMEILCEIAKVCGASSETLDRISECVMVDEGVSIIRSEQIEKDVMELLLFNIQKNIRERLNRQMEIGVIVFSNKYGLLGKTTNVEEIVIKMQGGK
ncbi:MAG: cobalt-precorrin-5B (C(1))-methyltransferase CbiD [Anaerovoracaceae bacterium]